MIRAIQAVRQNLGLIEAAGLRFARSVDRPLPSGKAFWLGIFERLLA